MTPTVFTQPGCQPCRAVKRWLDSRGIAYDEADVSSEPKALAQLKEWGYMQAPVVAYEVDGEVKHFSGFNPYELEDLQESQAAVAA